LIPPIPFSLRRLSCNFLQEKNYDLAVQMMKEKEINF